MCSEEKKEAPEKKEETPVKEASEKNAPENKALKNKAAIEKKASEEKVPKKKENLLEVPRKRTRSDTEGGIEHKRQRGGMPAFLSSEPMV